ncbi:MAG: pyruvate kinase [Gammaproteobacteria bacterium]
MSLQLTKDHRDSDLLQKELLALLDELVNLEQKVVTDAHKRLDKYLPYFDAQIPNLSAVNLAHYLSIRHTDLRPLQKRLAHVGLSSLGRSESAVAYSLRSIIELLARATNSTLRDEADAQARLLSPEKSAQLIADHCAHLFGPLPASRNTYIMVTLPSDAAWNGQLIESFMAKGMNCARINCAHDDAIQWQSMINHVRQAEEKLKLPCKILMDLAGHKIRTGSIKSGPAVKHIKVNRNVYGRLVGPTDILLDEEHAETSDSSSDIYRYRLTLPRALHTQLAIGDRLRLTDVRGKKRDIVVVGQRSAKQWLAQCTQSIYLSTETELTWQRKNKKDKYHTLGEFTPCPFEGEAEEIRLFEGDPLFLSAIPEHGSPARFDENGIIVAPARISCNPPQAVHNLKPGEPVWFDDGKLGCVVESVNEEGVLLVVTHARPKGVRLKEDKGINFPESEINLPPLTDKDIEDLDFITEHADMIGFSFVENLNDINALLDELNKRKAQHLPLIAKIETNKAVANLPEIILGSIGRVPLGVMIARGDLAVELGGERLAEIQEEILWLCEAAQVPVIWATQVLETMAKDGAISRPEFTDAAMAERAECVMLNKGPYIEKALQTLDDIIIRMEAHQHKKRSFMRALQW